MARLSEAFRQTCLDSTILHWIIDADDPLAEDYREAYQGTNYPFQAFWLVPPGPAGIVHPLNWVVDEIFRPEFGFYPTILGFMGDDHIPRTPEWDIQVSTALSELGTGLVYGDDLLQHERLPTAAFMTKDIIQALGYMVPPEFKHLYVDDWWKEVATRAGCLRYLPEVIIEHLHYLVGKAEKDETYTTVNDPKLASADKRTFEVMKRDGTLEYQANLIIRLRGDGQ